MNRIITLAFLLLVGLFAKAQSYPLEWSNYTGQGYFFAIESGNNNEQKDEAKFRNDLLDLARANLSKQIQVKVEEVSQWGTVLKRDVYEDAGDGETYICHFLRYNYQAKKLEDVGQKRVDKDLHQMKYSESEEMALDQYLNEMWGRYADDNYRNSFWDADE